MEADSIDNSLGLIGLVTTANPETAIVLLICAIFSIMSWYIIGAKWFELNRLRAAARKYQDIAERNTTIDERQQAAAALGDSPFGEVITTVGRYLSDLKMANERDGISRSGLSLTQLEALSLALDSRVKSASDHAGRMIPWLAIIAAAAPLLGLLGTVLGIMQSFAAIGVSGSTGLATVAPGIADALVATAAGLAAAIPAVIAYNVFTARIERFEGELERAAQDEIASLGREGKL
jgi:biopolymer transport protein TolQ